MDFKNTNLEPLTLDNLASSLEGQPKFRIKQTLQAFFKQKEPGWNSISTLPKELRSTLSNSLKPSSIELHQLYKSNDRTTVKAILKLFDGYLIETVLMLNPKKQWTLCVSSQVGCAMGCSFCATGKMGQLRSLDGLEIAEQFLFWRRYLDQNTVNKNPGRISNVVFMGMGEPLANYDSVITAISYWLDFFDIGPNYITVSTVGVLNVLNKILTDPNWPNVKFAISLHSANDKIRKKIVPTHSPQFLDNLKKWCLEYEDKLGARTRPLTFEYVMLEGINDGLDSASNLGKYLSEIPRAKVNLIPFNPVDKVNFKATDESHLQRFMDRVQKHKVKVTVRRTKGQDISAACGQLVTQIKS